jgi:hypothetical protein
MNLGDVNLGDVRGIWTFESSDIDIEKVYMLKI